MVNQWNRLVSWGIAVFTGMVMLLCVLSGAAAAAGGVNYVNNTTVSGPTGSVFLNFSTDFDANFFNSTNTESEISTDTLIYVEGKTGLNLPTPVKSGMGLTFTVPKEALERTGTRGAFVYPNSSGYGTENGIRVAPDGEFGVLDRVALSYEEEGQTVSATFSLPPRTAFTPMLMYENPLDGVGVDFPPVSGMASGEASNVVSNTTIYGADGNATGYYDDDLVNNGTYMMDVITAHVENNTAAPVYLSVANSSLENLTSEGKNKITLYDVRGAAIRNASAFQLNGTMSGINVTGWDGTEVVVSLENVTRNNVSMQFNVSTDEVEHPRVVNLTADTLATVEVLVDNTMAPVVTNLTVTPNNVAASIGTLEVTLAAELLEIGDIPSEYTVVEWIQSSGTQWIDTGYCATSNTKIVFDWMDVNTGSKSVGVFDSNNNPEFGVSTAGSGSKWCLHYGSSENISGGFSRNVKYHICQDKNKLYVDGVLVSSLTAESFSLSDSLYMFGENVNNCSSALGYERFYSAQIYENDILQRNFVPCVRNGDGAVGMYDTVTKKFFVNSGSGIFSYGPVKGNTLGNDITFNWYAKNASNGFNWELISTTVNVNTTIVNVSMSENTSFCVNVTNIAGSYNSSINNPTIFSVKFPLIPVITCLDIEPEIISVGDNGGMKEVELSCCLDLPSNYTRLEYIESSGSQYIDTKYVPNSDTKIEFRWMDIDSGSVGIFDVKANPGFGISSGSQGSVLIVHYYDSEYVYSKFSKNIIYDLIQDKNCLYIDGELSTSVPSANFATEYNIYMFCENDNGVATAFGSERFYSARIYENDILQRNFVPCVRNGDRAVGMYDTVTGKFFGNAGSGDFIAGPEVGNDYGDVTYSWYARNASTNYAWTFVESCATNSTMVSVSTWESTEFCVNASNIAGFDNTSANPLRFTAVHEPVVEEITVTPATVQAEIGSGVQTVNVTAEPRLIDLPAGYKQVEWIKSCDSSCAIATGIVPTLDYTVEVKAIKATGNSLFGSGSNGFTFTGSGINYAYIGGVEKLYVTVTDQSVPHIWKLSNRTAYCDDYYSAQSTGANQPSLDLYLFCRNKGNSLEDGGIHTIYYAKIWDENGELVRDFIPCVCNSDNEIGMYDVVSGTFFGNIGTGSFTAGPEVSHYGTVNYEWFSRNASTNNGDWVSVGNTSLNRLSYTVSTTENTQFSVNASNIAGNNESTKDNPAKFAVYTTLSLDTVGGDNSSQVVNATYGSSVLDKTVNASTKKDFTFRGWDVIASPKNLTVINETGVLVAGVDGYTDANGNWTNATGAITLYANWSSVYTIRYHANNGTTVNVTKTDIPYNTDVKLNSTEELGFTPQEGLTFVNWTTYANGTGSSYADEAEVKNLAPLDETADLYAVWQTNQTALNSSTAEVTIGGTAYTKWNASKNSPYVVGYDTFNGTAVFGPFVIESPGAGQKLNYTLTAQNLTEADELGRVIVTYFDGSTFTKLDNTTGFTFEDHDGKGYLNLTETGRKTTGLSNVSVVVKEYPLGDANTNDLVDIVDSASVGVYILKGGGETISEAADIFLPDENKVHGDVNHDGLVDVADMRMINQYLVGSSVLV